MKKYIATFLIIVGSFLFGVTQCNRANKNKDLYETEAKNVEILRQGQKDYKIKDSIQASELNAVTLSKNEFERLYKDAKNEIANLQGNKKKDVEYITKFKTNTETVWRDRIDTIYVNGDTCRYYADKYTSVMFCNDSVKVQSTDVINQYISKHYKHKFLWFKWKMDGVTQDIYNENPNSKIQFEQFLKIQ